MEIGVAQQDSLADQQGDTVIIRVLEYPGKNVICRLVHGVKDFRVPLFFGDIGLIRDNHPGILIAVGLENADFVIVGVCFLVTAEQTDDGRLEQGIAHLFIGVKQVVFQ